MEILDQMITAQNIAHSKEGETLETMPEITIPHLWTLAPWIFGLWGLGTYSQLFPPPPSDLSYLLPKGSQLTCEW